MQCTLPVELFKPPQEQIDGINSAEQQEVATPFEQQEKDFQEYLLRVSVSLQNVKSCMLIDTGASRTVLDKAFAENITEVCSHDSLKTLGAADVTMQAFFAKIQNFRIGDLCIPNYVSAVIDLGHINVAFQSVGLPPIAGLIGLDILSRFKASINFSTNTLKLNFSKKDFYKLEK